LVNKTAKSLDTLVIHSSNEVATTYQLNKTHMLAFRDSIENFEIVRLNESIHPGDSLLLTFRVQNIPNSILKKNSPVEKNGTFMTSSIFPEIGYYTDQSQTPPSDSAALRNHYRAIDADFVDWEMTAGIILGMHPLEKRRAILHFVRRAIKSLATVGKILIWKYFITRATNII
jgi:ABC-2 type transport system permease protein